jgi:hypothetical protein
MDSVLYLLLEKPAYQALLFLVLTPILILIIQPKSAERAWSIAAYAFGVFLIGNAALLWVADSPWRYFFYSIGCALGYLLFSAIIMRILLRGLRLKSSEESAMAFLIIIYQPVALLVVMLAKWIVTTWL